MDGPLQFAAFARRRIQQVRSQLLSPSPDVLIACAGPLNEAIAFMEKLQSFLGGTPRRSAAASQLLRNEIVSLRRELAQANALLEAAGRFYEGYGRLLGQGADAPQINYGVHSVSIEPDASQRLVTHG